MKQSHSMLFVQNRTHRGGAQTALARLLAHPGMRRWRPVLVCSRGGWLAEECRRNGIDTIEENFRSSRSVLAQLFWNRAFARRVCKELHRRGIHPSIVQANDHQEGLLGLQLARILNAKTAIFLRSSAMTRRDFYKYGCHKYQFVGAIGGKFRDQVQAWVQEKNIEVLADGIHSNEFFPPKQRSSQPPSRILIIGSAQTAKGWADLTEALYFLQQQGDLPELRCDFTGIRPSPAQNNLGLERLKKVRCSFLGRVEEFRELVSGYDLVINPSRAETFGIAAVEVLAAGVPLLSSRTGVIEEVQKEPSMLFAPGDPVSLANALKRVLSEWPRIDFGIAGAQKAIQNEFLIDRVVERMDAIYTHLNEDRTNS